MKNNSTENPTSGTCNPNPCGIFQTCCHGVCHNNSCPTCCPDGTCSNSTCTTPCPSDQKCGVNGCCLNEDCCNNTSCTTDSTSNRCCPDGQWVANETCCSDNSCPTGQTCNTNTYTCSNLCPSDQTCGLSGCCSKEDCCNNTSCTTDSTLNRCCPDGQWVANETCCSDNSCPTGQTCNTSTNKCAAKCPSDKKCGTTGCCSSADCCNNTTCTNDSASNSCCEDGTWVPNGNICDDGYCPGTQSPCQSNLPGSTQGCCDSNDYCNYDGSCLTQCSGNSLTCPLGSQCCPSSPGTPGVNVCVDSAAKCCVDGLGSGLGCASGTTCNTGSYDGSSSLWGICCPENTIGNCDDSSGIPLCACCTKEETQCYNTCCPIGSRCSTDSDGNGKCIGTGPICNGIWCASGEVCDEVTLACVTTCPDDTLSCGTSCCGLNDYCTSDLTCDSQCDPKNVCGYQCCNQEFQTTGQTCCTDSTPGSNIANCCNEGQYCCNGMCQTSCNYCCSSNSNSTNNYGCCSTECCGTTCCEENESCCGATCCQANEICDSVNNRCITCPEIQLCGSVCCPSDEICGDATTGNCIACPEAQSCGDTCCAIDQLCDTTTNPNSCIPCPGALCNGTCCPLDQLCSDGKCIACPDTGYAITGGSCLPVCPAAGTKGTPSCSCLDGNGTPTSTCEAGDWCNNFAGKAGDGKCYDSTQCHQYSNGYICCENETNTINTDTGQCEQTCPNTGTCNSPADGCVWDECCTNVTINGTTNCCPYGWSSYWDIKTNGAQCCPATTSNPGLAVLCPGSGQTYGEHSICCSTPAPANNIPFLSCMTAGDGMPYCAGVGSDCSEFPCADPKGINPSSTICSADQNGGSTKICCPGNYANVGGVCVDVDQCVGNAEIKCNPNCIYPDCCVACQNEDSMDPMAYYWTCYSKCKDLWGTDACSNGDHCPIKH